MHWVLTQDSSDQLIGLIGAQSDMSLRDGGIGMSTKHATQPTVRIRNKYSTRLLDLSSSFRCSWPLLVLRV